MKLEIGPKKGKSLPGSWETMDSSEALKPTYVHDIRFPMTMIEDDTYDLIYASHVLEHIPWYEVGIVLNELYRILKPGGSLEVWVPDFEKILQVYLDQKIPDGWKQFNPERLPFKWVLGRLFCYARDNHSDYFHRGAFDRDYLKHCLQKAEFVEVTDLSKPRGYNHGYVNLGMSGMKPYEFD